MNAAAIIFRFALAAVLLAAAVAAQLRWPTAQPAAPAPAPLSQAVWDAWLRHLPGQASAPAPALPPPIFLPPPAPVQPRADVPRAREIAPRHWRIDAGTHQGNSSQ